MAEVAEISRVQGPYFFKKKLACTCHTLQTGVFIHLISQKRICDHRKKTFHLCHLPKNKNIPVFLTQNDKHSDHEEILLPFSPCSLRLRWNLLDTVRSFYPVFIHLISQRRICDHRKKYFLCHLPKNKNIPGFLTQNDKHSDHEELSLLFCPCSLRLRWNPSQYFFNSAKGTCNKTSTGQVSRPPPPLILPPPPPTTYKKLKIMI